MTKRCWDVVVAASGLVALAPLLLSIVVLILATDGRPVLFRQRRVGWRGRRFHVYKFRTMRLAPQAEAGSFDAGNGSRVTRIGRLLRRTKLDELPQLWNVLRGDMSLVGPRPEVETWVAAYPERWALVHEVRPGITDPASIIYRDEEQLLTRASSPEEAYRHEILPHKLSLYERYIRTRTFWGDLHIIFQTAVAVLHPHPAKERP